MSLVATDLGALCDDLLAETEALERLVTSLDDAGWSTATPAPGWDVRDQVAHLAYFDERAHDAIVDPDRLRGERDAALARGDLAIVDAVTSANHRLSGPTAWAWLQQARAALVAAARPLDASRRVPWYGPDMSLASLLTARMMETWAHGQDVADALGVTREATNRLRHVAFIGARAVANSFVAHGRAVPDTPLRVELDAPSGEHWVFGPDDAKDVVRGPALDFCLLVTQRRHVDDLDLHAQGAVAREWLAIAQAFAGPPGPGRQPGQFGVGD